MDGSFEARAPCSIHQPGVSPSVPATVVRLQRRRVTQMNTTGFAEAQRASSEVAGRHPPTMRGEPQTQIRPGSKRQTRQYSQAQPLWRCRCACGNEPSCWPLTSWGACRTRGPSLGRHGRSPGQRRLALRGRGEASSVPLIGSEHPAILTSLFVADKKGSTNILRLSDSTYALDENQ